MTNRGLIAVTEVEHSQQTCKLKTIAVVGRKRNMIFFSAATEIYAQKIILGIVNDNVVCAVINKTKLEFCLQLALDIIIQSQMPNNVIFKQCLVPCGNITCYLGNLNEEEAPDTSTSSG